MDVQSTLALAMGAAWASGINVYATIGMLGVLGATDSMVLPPGLEVLEHPAVLIAAWVMFAVEFFADKIPGLDSAWDAIHTFIRIPAGAVLAAQALGPVDPAIALTAALLGGSLAAGTHATKAGTRLMLNTSPEPVSNWVASVSEDVAVVVALWTAVNHPWVLFAIVASSIVVMALVLPLVIRGARSIIRWFLPRKQGEPVVN